MGQAQFNNEDSPMTKPTPMQIAQMMADYYSYGATISLDPGQEVYDFLGPDMAPVRCVTNENKELVHVLNPANIEIKVSDEHKKAITTFMNWLRSPIEAHTVEQNDFFELCQIYGTVLVNIDHLMHIVNAEIASFEEVQSEAEREHDEDRYEKASDDQDLCEDSLDCLEKHRKQAMEAYAYAIAG